jgi:hypothetical protein
MRMGRNYKEVGTHIPTLIKVMGKIKGDVCEVGAGFASTPFLHWLCQGRKLVTYENDHDYFHFAKKFQTNNHRIRTLKQIEFDRHWSVVFIDHDNKEITRGDMALKFTNADVIILHDTEPRVEENYGYLTMWPKFKYRYDWTETRPWTSVVSNKIDVTKWK